MIYFDGLTILSKVHGRQSWSLDDTTIKRPEFGFWENFIGHKLGIGNSTNIDLISTETDGSRPSLLLLSTDLLKWLLP